MRKLLVLAAIVGVSVLAVPTAGANVTGFSVEVGSSATLVAGVYLQVPVTFTCLADESSLPFTYVDSWVDVTQKVGKDIAHGRGYITGDIICDGIPHASTASVFPPNEGGLAFKGGKAVVTGGLFIQDAVYAQYGTYFGPTTLQVKGGR